MRGLGFFHLPYHLNTSTNEGKRASRLRSDGGGNTSAVAGWLLLARWRDRQRGIEGRRAGETKQEGSVCVRTHMYLSTMKTLNHIVVFPINKHPFVTHYHHHIHVYSE